MEFSCFANSEAERRLAHGAAHRVNGVRSVRNDILLK